MHIPVLVSVLFLGLLNWIITNIIVAAEIFREPREALKGCGDRLKARSKQIEGSTRPRRFQRYCLNYAGGKLAYVLGCQLCTGVWVGFVLAAVVFPGPFVIAFPLASIVVNGLLYKAVGHIILELTALAQNKNAQLARQNREAEEAAVESELQRMAASQSSLTPVA